MTKKRQSQLKMEDVSTKNDLGAIIYYNESDFTAIHVFVAQMCVNPVDCITLLSVTCIVHVDFWRAD